MQAGNKIFRKHTQCFWTITRKSLSTACQAIGISSMQLWTCTTSLTQVHSKYVRTVLWFAYRARYCVTLPTGCYDSSLTTGCCLQSLTLLKDSQRTTLITVCAKKPLEVLPTHDGHSTMCDELHSSRSCWTNHWWLTFNFANITRWGVNQWLC